MTQRFPSAAAPILHYTSLCGRAGRLGTDWTQRRETLEKFVVKYDKPEHASTAGTPSTGEGPTRYCNVIFEMWVR